MAESENNVELKRKADETQDGDGNGEDDEWVGPMPSEATKAKKRKGQFLVITEPHFVYLRLPLNEAK